jgi:hypothetical protein
MGRIYSMDGANIWSGNLVVRSLGVDCKIILKLVSVKVGVKSLTGLNWLRIGSIGVLLW